MREKSSLKYVLNKHSDTPRTDAECNRISSSGIDWYYSASLMAVLAKTLEMELRNERMMLAMKNDTANVFMNQVKKLQQQVGNLTEHNSRLLSAVHAAHRQLTPLSSHPDVSWADAGPPLSGNQMNPTLTQRELDALVYILSYWGGNPPYDGTTPGSDNPSREEAQKLAEKIAGLDAQLSWDNWRQSQNT